MVSDQDMVDQQPAKLVFSYRREESSPTVGRLQDWLQDVYGRGSVYRDIDDIPLGKDFRQELRREIETADALLVVIGPRWLTLEDDHGRRLDNENDFVRLEIEAAIANEVALVPLYVNGALPPSAGQLPGQLERLVWAEGHQIRNDPDFVPDTQRLLKRLADLVPPPSSVAGTTDTLDEPHPQRPAPNNQSQKGRSTPGSPNDVLRRGLNADTITPYIAGVIVVAVILAIILIVITS